MVEELERLKQAIAIDIERRKTRYSLIGKEGKDYYDIKSLDAANKAYIERMYAFIGRDGREYSTTKELDAANKIYDDVEVYKKR